MVALRSSVTRAPSVAVPRPADRELASQLRHREDFANGRMLKAKLDEYSSAVSFDGWTRRFPVPEGYKPLPVSPPQTELLRGGKNTGASIPSSVPGRSGDPTA